MQQKSKKSWVHMFHDKYLNNMFFLSSVRSFGSPIWNSISKAKLALLKGFTYKVGDETFSFWFSFLLSNEQLCKKVELVVIQSTSTKWFLFQFLLTFKWSLHLCSKWYKDTQLESSLRVRIAIVWMWMSVVWVYRVELDMMACFDEKTWAKSLILVGIWIWALWIILSPSLW
jgi:hypothetical protein